MPTFSDLLEHHAATSMEKQWHLETFLGEHQWNLDLELAKMTFTLENQETIECPVQLLGTQSYSSNTWLWAWANSASSDWSADGLQAAHLLQELGAKEGVEEFTVSQFELNQRSGHEMGIIACGICQENAYYVGDYGSGAAICLIKLPQLQTDQSTDALRMSMVMTRVINGIAVNHKSTLLNYAKAKGYPVLVEGSTIKVTCPNQQILRTEFDQLGRLTNIETTISPS
jgi:hypothetical protein